MNPISIVTGAVMAPARAVAGLAGTSVGVAGVGLRRSVRLAGWVVERVAGSTSGHPASPWSTTDRPASATGAPVTDSPPVEVPEVSEVSEVPEPATAPAPRPAPSAKAAVLAPALGLSEDELPDAVLDDSTDDAETDDADELRTPSGIPAAGAGVNPDTTETDLHQPGTEPLMDPATVKAVASEAEVMRRASDPDKG